MRLSGWSITLVRTKHHATFSPLGLLRVGGPGEPPPILWPAHLARNDVAARHSRSFAIVPDLPKRLTSVHGSRRAHTVLLAASLPLSLGEDGALQVMRDIIIKHWPVRRI